MPENLKKVTPRTLPGFMELLPSDQVWFNELLDKIRYSYERFGFLPLDTPVIEDANILLAKTGGETSKQIYSFSKGDSELALRFDLTVPLAKYISIHQGQLTFPFRRYQIGKVYRGERPQQGRFREFYQCDIDIIGNEELDIMHDAEIPSIIYTTFTELGFSDFTIKINNRKILNGFFDFQGVATQSAEIMRAIDKRDKLGDKIVIEELTKIAIPSDIITTIMNFISFEGTNEDKLEYLKGLDIKNELYQAGIAELEQVISGIHMFGIPANNFMIDLTIARGLDYYTGTVYETFLNQYREVGSICSGGRYDNLSEFYTTKKMPGVGISIGLTRLFYLLNKMEIIRPTRRSITEILVIPMSNDTEATSMCLHVATILRKNGINTEIFMSQKKTKAKFAYADKLNIPFTLIIGEDEVTANKVMFKDMTTGEQSLLTTEDVVAKFNNCSH